MLPKRLTKVIAGQSGPRGGVSTRKEEFFFSRLFDYFSKAERPRPEFRNMYVLFSELVENQNALFPQPFQALEKNNQKVQETKNFKTFRSLDSSASVVGHGHGQVTGRNPDSKAITYVQEFS